MSKHSLLVVSYSKIKGEIFVIPKKTYTGAIIVISILCHITPSVFKGAFSLKEGKGLHTL